MTPTTGVIINCMLQSIRTQTSWMTRFKAKLKTVYIGLKLLFYNLWFYDLHFGERNISIQYLRLAEKWSGENRTNWTGGYTLLSRNPSTIALYRVPWLLCSWRCFVGYWMHQNVHRSNDVRFVVETSAVGEWWRPVGPELSASESRTTCSLCNLTSSLTRGDDSKWQRWLVHPCCR